MSANSTKTLALVDRIYDSAVRPEAWEPCLLELCAATGATFASLSYRFESPPGCLLTSRGLEPAGVRAYEDHYHWIDPSMPTILSLPVGWCALSESLFPEGGFEETEFYNDFARAQGIAFSGGMGAKLVHDATQMGAIALTPAWGAVLDRDAVPLVRSLVPHLQRAVEIHRRLVGAAAVQADAAALMDRLAAGIVLLDGAGRVLRANAAASEILGRRDGLVVRKDGTLGASGAEAADLFRLVDGAVGRARGAVPGGALAIRQPSGRGRLALFVTPLRGDAASRLGDGRAAAALFLSEIDHGSEPPEALVRKLFRLTPAEARLAVALAAGKAPKEAAYEMGIAWNTARNQLKQVFAKTGADRQATLVRLLLTALPRLREG